MEHFGSEAVERPFDKDQRACKGTTLGHRRMRPL
jgi:hypothetical protein